MGDTEKISGNVLGQISLMQSVVAQLPNKLSILRFVCQGFKDIPGVEKVEYRIFEEEKGILEPLADPGKSFHKFSITYKGHTYSELLLKLANQDAFSPYIPFIENFINMLSIIFEERNQRKLNQKILTDLEKRVYERTRELETEIGERKQTEDSLRKSETYLRTLINTIPDLVWLKDKNGVYLFCNSRFERFFGAEEKRIIGQTDYDFVDKNLADFFRENDKLAMSKGGPSINEEEVTYADDGHLEILETIKTPLYDSNGKLIGVLGIARDITERIQAEKERKKLEGQLRQSHKMEAIGTLAGGIAHEFNNMLGIIIGNLELAFDDIPEWNPAKDSLNEIKTASLRAKNVVQKLLSVARKTPESKKPIQIGSIIKESLDLMRRTIPTAIDIQKNITCSTEMILGDPTEISQVVINLCTNSVHAMNEGTGILEVALNTIQLNRESALHYEDFKPGDYINLTVKDTGDGIKPAFMDRLFDPYFTTKDLDQGLGMGLAIVHGIVKKHDGAIKIKSEIGKGTTVEILFPLIEEQTRTIAEEFEKPQIGTESILLVDDEPSIVKMVTQMLKRSGYEVIGKTSSSSALKAFKETPEKFDLVISDMAMPEMTGDRLAQEIKQIRSDIPIILCTGHSDRIDESKAKEMGIEALMMKPFSIKDIGKSIPEVLGKKRYRNQD